MVRKLMFFHSRPWDVGSGCYLVGYPMLSDDNIAAWFTFGNPAQRFVL